MFQNYSDFLNEKVSQDGTLEVVSMPTSFFIDSLKQGTSRGEFVIKNLFSTREHIGNSKQISSKIVTDIFNHSISFKNKIEYFYRSNENPIGYKVLTEKGYGDYHDLYQIYFASYENNFATLISYLPKQVIFTRKDNKFIYDVSFSYEKCKIGDNNRLVNFKDTDGFLLITTLKFKEITNSELTYEEIINTVEFKALDMENVSSPLQKSRKNIVLKSKYSSFLDKDLIKEDDGFGKKFFFYSAGRVQQEGDSSSMLKFNPTSLEGWKEAFTKFQLKKETRHPEEIVSKLDYTKFKVSSSLEKYEDYKNLYNAIKIEIREEYYFNKEKNISQNFFIDRLFENQEIAKIIAPILAYLCIESIKDKKDIVCIFQYQQGGAQFVIDILNKEDYSIKYGNIYLNFFYNTRNVAISSNITLRADKVKELVEKYRGASAAKNLGIL